MPSPKGAYVGRLVAEANAFGAAPVATEKKPVAPNNYPDRETLLKLIRSGVVDDLHVGAWAAATFPGPDQARRRWIEKEVLLSQVLYGEDEKVCRDYFEEVADSLKHEWEHR